MESKKLCIFILIATIAAIDADAPATRDFLVGEEKGWNVGVDVQAWVKDSEIIFGDTLIFKYPVGKENVIEVNEESYKTCTVPPKAKILSSGNDIVHVNTRGRRCFISGVENGRHCKEGNLKFCFYIPEPVQDANPYAEYVVGGDKGWTTDVDYQAWVKGKEFHLNDELVFNYPPGKHNVNEVDEAAYNQCVVPQGDDVFVFEGGHDVVKLQREGAHRFICGMGNGKHCQMGMKLLINVGPKKPNPLKGARKLVPQKD